METEKDTMETEKGWIAVTNRTPKLTPAEKKVLDLVSLARTNKEIAAILGISPSTVKRHLENLLRKLQLRNRVEAAIYGLVAKGCPSASARTCLLRSWRQKEMKPTRHGPFDQ